MVDKRTIQYPSQKGIDIEEALRNNGSYHALKAAAALNMTGAAAANVNASVAVPVNISARTLFSRQSPAGGRAVTVSPLRTCYDPVDL